ncbi:MAG: LysR family transcriptional regulator, partial [Oribacterium sp.]|nr:LysR family transcriptional regulator [Oribacterium sp.]
MDEKDIEIFRSLIKTGNVTKSSEKLYTTQSSLTKRIQKMEEELGCQLFIRTKKGVLPTPAAEKIL